MVFAGQTLDQVWNNHREIFGDFPSKDFPLMAKIVDAAAIVYSCTSRRFLCI